MARERESMQQDGAATDQEHSEDLELEAVAPYRPSAKAIIAVVAGLGLLVTVGLVRNEMLEKEALREEIANLQAQRNIALSNTRAIKLRMAKAADDKDRQAQRLAALEQERLNAEARKQQQAERLRQQTAPGWVAETYADGTEYEGFTDEGKPQGIGKYTQGDGTIYTGDWTHGSINQGIIEFADGQIYQGEILNYRRHGIGQATWMAGSRRVGDNYFGEYKNGSRNGNGRYTWANGDVYVGDFVDDYCNGKGRMVFANGDVYDGDFVWDLRSGQGRFTWRDGSFHVGSFDGGDISGYGERRYTDGTVEAGSWKNGVLVARYPHRGSRRTDRASDQSYISVNADWDANRALYGAYFKAREEAIDGSLCRYSDGSELRVSTLSCPLNN